MCLLQISAQSILQRGGIRQLPGICWYPAKRTGQTVNQGGTADKFLFVLDRSNLSGAFSFAPAEINRIQQTREKENAR